MTGIKAKGFILFAYAKPAFNPIDPSWREPIGYISIFV